MVSRSGDGDLLAPTLRILGSVPVRGSTRSGDTDKGGREALAELEKGVRAKRNAILAVDGPRGPRNRVHRGVAKLAADTGTPILPLVAIPSTRWILSRSWDRFQLPKPFARIEVTFGTPIEPASRETSSLVREVRDALIQLEQRADPGEAALHYGTEGH